ncbi:hypothetical protein CMO92_02155 [Candidatus Woesearchaeota archaeon]|nr:hypothetical protein [Candidatus Woesearchaeota archaeon]|tara:strand:- start:3344 stop:4039 length:696 start_codon:yes stop_codon:yes gene_type:complete
MHLKQILRENRPRERLQFEGPSALSDAELLAVILNTGTKKENVIDLSQKLLADHNLEGLSTASLTELQKRNGIGFVKACKLLATFELGRRTKHRATRSIQIQSPKDVYHYAAPLIQHLDKEQFVLLLLDSKNKVKKHLTISIGILDASLIHPREVFKPAIKESSRAIILVHNHPSGDPTASAEDKNITQALIETGRLIGIPVLDHIIIGKDRYYSYREDKIQKRQPPQKHV